MTRGGRAKARLEPERRCIATRTVGPKRTMLRFVVDPEGTLVPDLAGRLPGRGIWLLADAAALRRAADKGLFARAARQHVRVPPDLAERIERGLAQRLIESVALARKAGAAVAGREKTLAALTSGAAALLLQASDGSARERAGLRPPKGPETLFSCLSGQELGMVFGRDRVIHAAVLAGGLAERIRAEARRLDGLRGMEFGATSSGDGVMDHIADDAAAGEGFRPERQTTE